LANFREFEAVPSILGEPADNYIQIKARERNDQEIVDNITKYCYVLGNPREGYSGIFNNLTPNKTLTLTYQRFPTGLATLTDICELPDPTFVTSKVESYVLQSRGDERFPFVNTVAEQKLVNMVGRESKRPEGGINETPKPVSPLG